MAARKKKKTTIGPEEALYEYAKSLKRHANDRRAVHVKLSILGKYYRQIHHLRTVSKSFDKLLRRFEGQLFLLSNSDIVVCLKGARISDIDDVIIKIRYMFEDDETLRALEARSDEDVLCRWFDLAEDYSAFLEFAEQGANQDPAAGQEDTPAAEDGGGLPAPSGSLDANSGQEKRQVVKGIRPGIVYREISHTNRSVESRDMTVSDLSKLVRAISTADLAGYLRRRNIILMSRDHEPKPILTERHVPLADIRQALLPSCREDAEPYLKRYLQQTVDQRTLRCIQHIDESGALATSLRTSIKIIGTTDFKEFEARCAAQGGQRIVLEFSIIDIMLDVVGYLNVRAELRARGYRVMIGDMDPFAFISLDRLELPCDFEKVRWVPEFEDYRHARPQELFRNTVEKVGNHRVILSGCNDNRAIEFGQSVGINLFCGSHIDNL